MDRDTRSFLPLNTQGQPTSEQKTGKTSKVHVSVIIPTHNRADFLRSAITSVLKQTFQDFELIVVDDFSGDHTSEVVRSFIDRNIRYIQHTAKKGGAAARNTGIRSAQGKYIAFLDDDDEWLPEKLKHQVELLNHSSPETGGVYTAFIQIDKVSGDIIYQKTAQKSGNLLHALRQKNCIGSTSSVLLRRECFSKVGLFDENLRSLQDYDLWVRIAREFEFVSIDKPLLIYHVHHSRISTNAEALHQGLTVMLNKHGLTKSRFTPSFGYSISLEIGTLYYLQNNIQKARQYYLKAIKLYPLGIRAYVGVGISLLGSKVFKRIKQWSNWWNSVDTSPKKIKKVTRVPALRLTQELSETLDRENIRYCHWKSNQALHRSLSGDNDLDLLIDPAQRFQFSKLLVRLGFKQASTPEDFRYPGIFNFYGHDRETGKIVHVHVHYRLLVGSDLLKNYDLPFVKPYLTSAHKGDGLRVPSVEFEYIIFVIRMVLKRRFLPWLLGHPDPRILFLAFSPTGRPGLRGSEACEWHDFQFRVKREEIDNLLSKYLPSIDRNLFEACERSLQPTAQKWEWLSVGFTLCSALKSYQKYSTPFAAVHAIYRRAETLLPVVNRYLKFKLFQPQKRRLSAGMRVIAFVGGDGSGKTTNLKALQAWLGKTLDVQTFHLGLPPLSPIRIFYLLISKTIRLLMGNKRETQVKLLHAITQVLVARGRWKLVNAALSAARKGTIVLCDRFPLKELKLSDGPLIRFMNSINSPLISWLAAIEESYYKKIADLGLPHEIIVLRVDPQMAIDRKPEEDPDFTRPRLQEILDTDWNTAKNSKVTVIDTSQPLQEVLAQVRNTVWTGLPSWVPHIEVVGHAGAGKTTLVNELAQRGVIASGEVTPADHPFRLLKNVMALWRSFFIYPFAVWKWMVVEETQGDLQEHAVQSRNFHVPVVYDQGPLFAIAWSHFIRPKRLQSRLFPVWHHRQIHRTRQILDLIIWLNADRPILRKRINSRPKVHMIKGKHDEEQNQFLSDFDHYFKLSISDKSGINLFSSLEFRTDDATPSELAEKFINVVS